MARVRAYHVIFCTHGFWLPNDPRGSGSTAVRVERLRTFEENPEKDGKRPQKGSFVTPFTG